MQKKTRALSTEASETPLTKVENPELDLILHFVNIEHLWITAKRTGPLKTKSADQPPRRAGASTSSANTILTLSSADDPDFDTFLNDNIFD